MRFFSGTSRLKSTAYWTKFCKTEPAGHKVQCLWCGTYTVLPNALTRKPVNCHTCSKEMVRNWTIVPDGSVTSEVRLAMRYEEKTFREAADIEEPEEAA